MSKNIAKIALFVVVGFFAFIGNAEAQFSKAVVVLKGTVINKETNAPHSVNVSVREVGNKALEITASRSNAESGKYLVVLKPQTKYWIHVEGDGVETYDELIETPATVKTMNLSKDLFLRVLSKNTAKK
jgi:hypothetical protein